MRLVCVCYWVLTAMLLLGNYLEYHSVEHILMPLSARSWYVLNAIGMLKVIVNKTSPIPPQMSTFHLQIMLYI